MQWMMTLFEIQSSCALLLTVFILRYQQVTTEDSHVSNANYIRHFSGKCLRYNQAHGRLEYDQLCTERFEWKEGVRLVHVRTKRCLTVNGTSDGSFLSLSHQCNDTSGMFQYDERARVVIHLFTGKCLHPENGIADITIGTPVVLKTGCSENASKFYFRKKAYYIIRHYGGLCWVYIDSMDIIKLKNPMACDRFEYIDDNHLRHVRTGKCVIYSSSNIRLTDDCSSPATAYHTNQNLQLRHGVHCVQPASGSWNPPVYTLLSLAQCGYAHRFKFNFYDDKDTLKVEIQSESCNDISFGTSCSHCKGFVTVNGRQYSSNSLGINVVLFDYRSGLFEEATKYQIDGSSKEREQLTSYLNNLPNGKILFLSAKGSVDIDSNLADALQKIGVSATFATTPVPKKRMSLAFVGFTGQERKIWEKSINKLGGSGGSTLQVTINTFVDRDGVNDCSDELGIRVKRIPPARFFATSVLSSSANYEPFFASLHQNTQWCSKTYTTVSKEYLQVDLGVVKLVSGIAMQGHSSSYTNRVTEFKIQYSENGVSWQFYKDLQHLVQKFNGTRTERMQAVDTKVSWFLNTRARFVRIIGTLRRSVHYKSCFRFELFGCSIARSFLSVEWTPDSSSYINDTYKGSISTFGTVQENVTVGISASGDNQSLATNIGHINLLKLNASTIVDNGTLLEDTDDNIMVKDKMRQINSAAVVQFDIKEQNYHAFDIDFSGNILDDGLPTGYRNFTVTSETGDVITVYSAPFLVNRWQRDQSILQLNATHENEEWYTDNSSLHLNLSLSHMAVQSHANAYGVNIMIYYNSEFLQFRSIELVKTSAFTLPTSRNVTRPGLILIQNDAVWLQNDQFFSIKFQVSIPKGISRGVDCNGNILIDFSYHNNLAKLNGTVTTTLERPVPFKCKVNQAKDIKVKSVRLPSPEFSMVYDEINQDFFFCLQRKIYMTRNAPTCFLQQKGKTSLGVIPFMSTVEAIDVEKRILYGLDRVGKSYAMSVFPYAVMDQIEDSVWTAVKDQPQTRTSVKANTLDLLPSSPGNPMIITVSGKASWAATKRGILKEANGIWQRVTNFVL